MSHKQLKTACNGYDLNITERKRGMYYHLFKDGVQLPHSTGLSRKGAWMAYYEHLKKHGGLK